VAAAPSGQKSSVEDTRNLGDLSGVLYWFFGHSFCEEEPKA